MTDQTPVRIGLIGCGVISNAYLSISERFPILDFVACADIVPEATKRTAEKYGLAAMSTHELLARDDIEVVLNLTIPRAHGEVNLAALESGKHAFCEKPFGLDVKEGERVLSRARELNLRLGCAPDTFLGGGHQTVRHLIDEGAVGRPLSGTAFMMSHGVETWHPSPEFYYKPGGGPLFDMGPYYITALVNSLGAVKRVAAITSRGFEQRTITSQPKHGDVIDVEVDTHASGVLEFHSGAVVTVAMSFDVWRHSNRFIEIHGTDRSITCPDPNGFGGRVAMNGSGREWEEQELTHANVENSRSIGLADMCMGIRTGRAHRASGDLAFHVLEVMDAFGKSSETGQHIELTSKPDRPAALPIGLAASDLD
ncbi:MAG: Gfo/Idh/MocA family oxidoreductase [Gammaproteobacteria bacterium]|nr:Gfo/Idh/MocA family oxidoreductase [Gammaproteobacteria bacterium]